MRRNTSADFWARCKGEGDCVVWTGPRSATGYGKTHFGGRHWRAHRLAFALARHDPGEAHVLHKCDNPPCCNPEHLFLGDPAANAADKAAKGRTGKELRSGSLNSKAKLDETKVREILSSAESGGELARKFGVSRTLINLIRHRKVWRHFNG